MYVVRTVCVQPVPIYTLVICSVLLLLQWGTPEMKLLDMKSLCHDSITM